MTARDGRRLSPLTLLLAITAGGCDQSYYAREFQVLSGTVEGSRSETRLLLVRVDDPEWTRIKEQRIACLVPADAEVYMNDRMTGFDAFGIGDTVELIGRFDLDTREERFVVSFAYIAHNEPPPPALVLAPPVPPTTQPAEN